MPCFAVPVRLFAASVGTRIVRFAKASARIATFLGLLQAVSALAAEQLTLTWDDNSDDELGFRLERSENGGPFVLLASLGADVVSFVDTPLVSGTAYAYRVLAYNATGDSAYSNVAVNVPTVISQPVASHTLVAFNPLSLSVDATGLPAPITYQWLRDGIPLSDRPGLTGTNGPTLNFTSVTTADAGAYSVLVSTGNGIFSQNALITVQKRSQQIQFPIIGAKLLGDSPLVLSATATSGLPVNFTLISGPAGTVIDGSTVSFNQGGTVTVRATQSGDSNYTAASPVEQSFTVDIAATVSASQTTTTAGGVVGSTISTAPISAGTAGVTAQLDRNGSGGAPDAILTIATYSGNPSSTAAFELGGGFVDVQVANAQLTDFADVTFYYPTTAVEANLVLLFLKNGAWYPVVSDGPAPITKDTTNNHGGTVSGGRFIVRFSATSTPKITELTGTGFTASLPVPIITSSLAVSTRVAKSFSYTITASNSPTSYTATPLPTGLFLNPSTGEISGTPTDVGTILVTLGATNPSGTANAALELTIAERANQNITFGSIATRTYGSPPFTLSASASSELPVTFASSNPGVATVSGSTVTIVGAGTTTITASQAGNLDFLPAGDVAQTLTVNKAAQTITFATLAAKTFGNAPFTLAATSTSGLPVSFASSNPAVATVSGNSVTIVGAGSTNLTASQAGNANYLAATNVVRAQTVNKASQTITFAALPSKTTGDPAFTLSATASSGLTCSYSSSDSAVATVSGNTVTIVGAGSTSITASQAGNTNYSAASNVTQSLTVTGTLTQTISFGALAAKTFGDAPFALTATVSSGLPVSYASSNSAVATISGNTLTIVGAGNTTITASRPGDATYTAATSVSQTQTVNRAAQTITFGALPAKLVSDAPFTLSATVSSGLTVSYDSSNTTVATVSGSTVTIAGAGTTTIRALQAGNANFLAATSVSRTLTVSTSLTPQTITFTGPADQPFSSTPIALSATATSGLTVSLSVVSGPATVNGSNLTLTGVGIVTVRASQAGNATYAAAPNVDRTFTVSQAAQTITFTGPGNQPFTFTPLALSATASSGLAVSFSVVSGPATVSGANLTLTGAGTVTVRASQAGNATYSAAPNVDRAFTVSPNFASWQAIKFTAPELADPLVSGPNAVFGLDGLPNLVKYALGLEPKQNITTGLPEITVVGPDWVYTYTRSVSITDVTYAVEVSTNLTTWTTVGVTHEFVSSAAGIDTWRGRFPLVSATNAFFRLKVTQP